VARVPTGGGDEHDDRLNYCLLLALYTLQGIPMVSFECLGVWGYYVFIQFDYIVVRSVG
jgi:hypothetical protein